MRDLSSFLKSAEDSLPTSLWASETRELDPNLQVSAYVAHLERQDHYPVFRFEPAPNLLGEVAPFPVVTNCFATREAIAAALCLDAQHAGIELALEYQRRATAELD